MRSMLFLALVGCAQAEVPTAGDRAGDGGIHVVDSGPADAPGRPIDAHTGPGVDSGSGSAGAPKTLDETTASDDMGLGISCGVSAQGYTVRNTFYRVFQLSNFGVTGTFHVTNVDFLIASAADAPSVTVSVGTYTGTIGTPTLTANKISLTANQTVTLPDVTYMNAQNQDVPITADVTGLLVVEVAQTVAGSTGDPMEFYIGANSEGETEPGYASTLDGCWSGIEDMSTIATSESDPIITVTGTM